MSVPRNEKLAAVFHRLKLIEAYGTGIPRIFEAYAKRGIMPEIPITNEGFLICLPNLSVAAKTAAVSQKPKTNKVERRVLDELAGRLFTKREAADVLGMTVSGAYKLLARMAERGLLTCKRNGREMWYEVK